MLLVILGVLDVLGGILLAISGFIPYEGSGFILTLGAVFVLKGIISYLAAAAKGFLFDLLGILDLIAGIMLILATYGFVVFFFPYVGILLIIKGAYSFVMGLLK
jgi:hypothetical protein